MPRPNLRAARLATLMVPVVATATILTGCSSGHHGTGASATTSPTTARSSTSPTTGTGTGPTTTVNPVVVSHPCRLVSRAEAEAILHISLKAPVEAPQGPTCIYETTKGAIAATVVVERASFTQIKPNVQHVESAVEAGHTTYCGVYGKPTLFAPLPQGSLLVVSAACPSARQLASKALARLTAG